ncbi:hypothetical protein [Hyalangium rubrum]|uniref:Uncharacterized protein n=1 Tax=Hyalangium rubrum TaxID=3103134 RepID=A0ABU5HA49_9BACT|nr:hypothetical protein [Hyalangium sp. s54d21]MDY7229693.1 hypothetical protein [Hyalangium sp. s54d21]
MTSLYMIQQGRAPGVFPHDAPLGTEQLHWIGGRPGVDLGDRWIFTLSRGGEPLWQAAVLFDAGGPFVESLVWEKAEVVLLGGGATFFALDLVRGVERLHRQVDMYFGHFELDPEWNSLYVLGGENIQKFDPGLNWMWTSERIAVDGIVATGFSGQHLHVSAEMDPPGGWMPVTLDVLTGQRVTGTAP